MRQWCPKVTSILFTRSLSSKSEPLKTCLYDFHISKNGKMCNFAGYALPTLYGKEGIGASHLHARYVQLGHATSARETYIMGWPPFLKEK